MMIWTFEKLVQRIVMFINEKYWNSHENWKKSWNLQDVRAGQLLDLHWKELPVYTQELCVFLNLPTDFHIVKHKQ